MRLSQNPACNPACSACHYKSFDYDEQLQRKQAWAQSNLDAWAKVLRPIIAAPPDERLGYRSKTWLQSSFENDGLSFGMFRAKQVDRKWTQEFISWDKCPLHLPVIQQMIERLREALTRHAGALCAEALYGIWMGSPHLVVVARDRDLSALETIDWSDILRAPFNRVWLHRTNQVGRTVFQHDRFQLLAGPPAESEHPILAFRQVAQTLLTEARDLACSHLLADAPLLVVDLYSGTGELSRLLPHSVSWLGIELSQTASNYAGGLRTRLPRVDGQDVTHESFTGKVEERLRDPRVSEKIGGRYALYINPPRSGLSVEAREQVLALVQVKPPTTLVFLSCSASSLSRDLQAFTKIGYQPNLLQPYDFFPQTEHFETLAVLAGPN